MRMLLIQTSAELTKHLMPPMGLMALATYLREQGFEASVHDLSFSGDPMEALRTLLAACPGGERYVLGFNMNTHIRFKVRESIEAARALMPEAVICVGGPHPTLDADDTLRSCPGLDFVVRGEGELTTAEALERLARNFSVGSLGDVEGVSWKDRAGEGEPVHNPPRARIPDLDILPIPDRDLVGDIRAYDFSFPVKDGALQKNLRATTVLTSRGCPYGCIFCSVADQWGRKTTFFSEDRVMEELTLIKEKYGFNAVYFFDDTFTLNRDRVMSLCRRMIDARLDLTWFAEVRANTVDEELLTLMHEAGLRSTAMGVESASPRILKDVIHKGIGLDQAREAIRVFKKLGIYCKTFFTYSYPTETMNDVRMTLDFAREVKPDRPAFGQLKLYPGTPLFAHARKTGKVPENFSWFEELPEYDAFMAQANVPIYQDRLTDDDLLRIAKEVNDIASELSGGWSRLYLKLKGLFINLSRVRRPSDLRIVLKKIQLHVRGGA